MTRDELIEATRRLVAEGERLGLQGMPFTGETGGFARGRTIAVGGERTVPAPDPIAREYLLLALRLDRHVPGLVDGYFGPADLKDAGGLGAAAAARAPARGCRGAPRAAHRGGRRRPSRRRWLDAQLVALEAQARALAGDPLPYLAHVTACFDFEPSRTDEAVFAAAAADLEALLPGDGALADRIAAWDDRFTIPADRLRGVVDALLPGFRARTVALFGLPAGEDLAVSLVRDQPWSGYNWYDGGLRSRGSTSTLTCRSAPPTSLALLAHETYPGHHTRARLEGGAARRGRGPAGGERPPHQRPECLLSEGLADLGRRFAVPPGDEADLLVEIYRLAGLPVAADAPAARDAAAARPRSAARSTAVRGVAGNAALLLHADGAPRDEVLAYLQPAPPHHPGARREAPRVHRAPAVADLRVRLLRGRASPRGAGWMPSRRPSRPPASGGSWSRS